jgi:hypothetical protein
MGALRDPVAPCSTWATSATHPAGTCQRGSRRPGRAHPTAEPVAPLPGVGQGHPHRPCHPPTIWSTTPQVRHGQPRTLTVLDLRPPYSGHLIEVRGGTNGKDAVTLDGRRRDHRHSSLFGRLRVVREQLVTTPDGRVWYVRRRWASGNGHGSGSQTTS